MISAVFDTLVYNPIYNGLVYFVGVLPNHDVGIAVIIVTIIVRIVLYPLSRSAIKTQMKMKEVAPRIEELKKKLKDKPEEQSKAIFALYREREVKPFSGFCSFSFNCPYCSASTGYSRSADCPRYTQPSCIRSSQYRMP